MIERIDRSCNGCGVCVLACRKDLIRMTRGDGGKNVAYFIDPRQCIVCYRCEGVCPVNAVQVGPEIFREAMRKRLPAFHRSFEI